MSKHLHSCRGAWTSTYYSWAAMVQRCTNPARNNYRLYGGRGVRVCDRWQSFENFLADMGARPAGTSLDRVDGFGDYEPSNCRWATGPEQARNRRYSKLTAADADGIRRLAEAGVSQRAIGALFGVSKTMARNVITGRAWV